MMIMNYKQKTGTYREVRIDLEKTMKQQSPEVTKELISIIKIQ